MATSSTHFDIPATITVEDGRTVIQFSRRLDLPEGEAIARFDQKSGDIHVEKVSHPEAQRQAWVTLLDRIANSTNDVHTAEFDRIMRERPLNRPPIEKNLFPHE